METKLNILKPFFDNPKKSFYIRELSRIIKINHTTVRLHLNTLVKEELLVLNNDGLYPSYILNSNKKTLNLKLYYNLENLNNSKLVDFLEKELDYPTIVLFGSYSKASDTLDSDIDICIISNIEKDLSLEKYEKILKKKVSLHLFNNKNFELAKNKNKELINNICNGIVLSGQLRVL